MVGLKVSTEILDVWGKELEEVFEDALKNSAEMFPVRYYDLLTALMTGPSYEGKDFMNNDCKEIVSDGLPEKCISTLDYNHGSVAIFYPGVADRLCKYLHTKDLYLTFPSINEVLVRPVGNGITAEILKSRISKELKKGQNQKDKLNDNINSIYAMIDSLSEEELFKPHMRKWAGEATKTAVWEVYKFIHVNTVAPFGTFRTKIRKWKKIAL